MVFWGRGSDSIMPIYELVLTFCQGTRVQSFVTISQFLLKLSLESKMNGRTDQQIKSEFNSSHLYRYNI